MLEANITRVNKGLLPIILFHLNHAVLEGNMHSCAVAVFLLRCIAQDEAYSQGARESWLNLSHSLQEWVNIYQIDD